MTHVVTVIGTVDPMGGSAVVTIKYGKDSTVADGSFVLPSPVTGSGPQPINQDISGLDANTDLFFMITAVNAGGEGDSLVQDITTLVDPPVAVLTSLSNKS
jgi:hypothetical protein